MLGFVVLLGLLVVAVVIAYIVCIVIVVKHVVQMARDGEQITAKRVAEALPPPAWAFLVVAFVLSIGFGSSG